MRLAAVVLLVACSATACGSGGSGSSGDAATATSTTVATDAPPVSAAAADPTCTQFHGTDGPLSTTGERPAALLVDASVDEVGCLDRVTFELESLGDGTPPGYTVGYQNLTEQPLLDENGNAIDVPAAAALVVTITPARSTDPRVPGAPATYRGNLRLSYGETHHIDIVRKLPDGASPDSVRWVIGLDGARKFLVDSASDPTRVSVYIG